MLDVVVGAELRVLVTLKVSSFELLLTEVRVGSVGVSYDELAVGAVGDRDEEKLGPRSLRVSAGVSMDGLCGPGGWIEVGYVGGGSLSLVKAGFKRSVWV